MRSTRWAQTSGAIRSLRCWKCSIPEQTATFRDHYLDLPFDLSHVLFVCTANTLDSISPALRDRMEIIQLSGYTESEKLQIAKRYLVPKQRKANGLRDSQAQFSDQAIRAIITEYTREAGVRNLEREIGTVCRKIARIIAEKPRYRARVKPDGLAEYLDRPRFYAEVKKRTASVGVSTGMFYTPVRRRYSLFRNCRDAGKRKSWC